MSKMKTKHLRVLRSIHQDMTLVANENTSMCTWVPSDKSHDLTNRYWVQITDTERTWLANPTMGGFIQVFRG